MNKAFSYQFFILREVFFADALKHIWTFSLDAPRPKGAKFFKHQPF